MGKFKGTFGSIPESSISSSGVSIRLTLPPGPGQRAQRTDAHLALYFGKHFGTEAGQAIISP